MIVFAILVVACFILIKYGDILWLLTVVPFYFFNMFGDFVPHDKAIYQRFADFDSPTLCMFLTALVLTLPIFIIANSIRNHS